MHKEKTVISYVKGALAEKSGDRIVVEAGPVGLGIYVPLSVLEVLPPLDVYKRQVRLKGLPSQPTARET